MSPVVSIIVPAFNRVAPLHETLRSVSRAAQEFAEPIETILVDDGSTPPLRLESFTAPNLALQIIAQENQGSIVARLTGLRAARGEFVLFLDSDDLIPADKLMMQVEALRETQADICYGNMAIAQENPGNDPIFLPGHTCAATSDVAQFFLRVQPAPHNPIYRRDYLWPRLADPWLLLERRFDPAGDVWLYYHQCIFPAKIAKLDRPVAAVGIHAEARFSLHWEILGLASLGVMEAFAARCHVFPNTEEARQRVGECAFLSWRRLPKNFNRSFEQRLLNLWRGAPRGPLSELGGPFFQRLALITGPVLAGKLLRLRNAPYAKVRTVSPERYNELFSSPTP